MVIKLVLGQDNLDIQQVQMPDMNVFNILTIYLTWIVQECNNQPSVPSLDLLGVFQESTLFFDFLRVLNSHILTYSVYKSVLANIKKMQVESFRHP